MFKGSNVSLVTPFKNDNRVMQLQVKLFHFKLKKGINGLFQPGPNENLPP